MIGTSIFLFIVLVLVLSVVALGIHQRWFVRSTSAQNVEPNNTILNRTLDQDEVEDYSRLVL